MRRIAFFVPHLGCPIRCSFCNQHSISGTITQLTPQQVELTLKEAVEYLGENVAETQIAFFGGSFTAIAKNIRIPLLEAAQRYCDEFGFAGIRFSTRPDCITKDILEDLSLYSVRTIELGAQSMDNRVLSMNRRGHSSSDTVNAAKLIKDAGIGLTLQMMVGLYGDSIAGVMNTAEKLASLKPEEVRIYPTLVLKGTELEQLYHSGEYKPLSLEEAIDCCGDLLEFFEDKNIAVIRLGLHQEKELTQNLLAGPHHPALRELCEGRNLYRKILAKTKGNSSEALVVYISSRDISKLTGHGGSLLKKLKAQYKNIKIETDSNLKHGEVIIKNN